MIIKFNVKINDLGNTLHNVAEKGNGSYEFVVVVLK